MLFKGEQNVQNLAKSGVDANLVFFDQRLNNRQESVFNKSGNAIYHLFVGATHSAHRIAKQILKGVLLVHLLVHISCIAGNCKIKITVGNNSGEFNGTVQGIKEGYVSLAVRCTVKRAILQGDLQLGNLKRVDLLQAVGRGVVGFYLNNKVFNSDSNSINGGEGICKVEVIEVACVTGVVAGFVVAGLIFTGLILAGIGNSCLCIGNRGLDVRLVVAAIGSGRLGIGLVVAAIGSGRLGIGLVVTGVGSSRLGIGTGCLGIGSSRLGIGGSCLGIGRSGFSIGSRCFGRAGDQAGKLLTGCKAHYQAKGEQKQSKRGCKCLFRFHDVFSFSQVCWGDFI